MQASTECAEHQSKGVAKTGRRRILLALDGKKQADYALQWYLDNLYRPKDEIILFHCSQFTLKVGLPGAAVNVEHVSEQVQKSKRDAEAVIAAATQILNSKGVKGHAVCKYASKPDEAILEAVAEHEVDQVVMGTRDLGAIKRTLVGSVSTAVVRHAKVPVTIVKIPH